MGPENRRIAAVSKLLASRIHKEKMYNPYRRGTPDMWYSGSNGDLWLEWKWIPRVPGTGLINPKLSPEQRRWIEGRLNEGRRVGVAVGFPGGNVIVIGKKCLKPINVYDEGVVDNREVARTIGMCV